MTCYNRLLDDPMSHPLPTLTICIHADTHSFYVLYHSSSKSLKQVQILKFLIRIDTVLGVDLEHHRHQCRVMKATMKVINIQYQSDTSMFILILTVVHKVLHLNTLNAVVRVRLSVCLSV